MKNYSTHSLRFFFTITFLVIVFSASSFGMVGEFTEQTREQEQEILAEQAAAQQRERNATTPSAIAGPGEEGRGTDLTLASDPTFSATAGEENVIHESRVSSPQDERAYLTREEFLNLLNEDLAAWKERNEKKEGSRFVTGSMTRVVQRLLNEYSDQNSQEEREQLRLLPSITRDANTGEIVFTKKTMSLLQSHQEFYVEIKKAAERAQEYFLGRDFDKANASLHDMNYLDGYSQLCSASHEELNGLRIQVSDTYEKIITGALERGERGWKTYRKEQMKEHNIPGHIKVWNFQDNFATNQKELSKISGQITGLMEEGNQPMLYHALGGISLQLTDVLPELQGRKSLPGSPTSSLSGSHREEPRNGGSPEFFADGRMERVDSFLVYNGHHFYEKLAVTSVILAAAVLAYESYFHSLDATS